MTTTRTETDSLGEVEVPADALWGAQTQRSLEHFSFGEELISRQMISVYALLKKAAAKVNGTDEYLDQEASDLIESVCDEIIAGQHTDMFPLHVWMRGSGTQFNMNMNEVISNCCCQLAVAVSWPEPRSAANGRCIRMTMSIYPSRRTTAGTRMYTPLLVP